MKFVIEDTETEFSIRSENGAAVVVTWDTNERCEITYTYGDGTISAPCDYIHPDDARADALSFVGIFW